MALSDRFPPYTQFDPAVPVVCATPGVEGVIHRFFDTSPFSPSGRYLALTRFPFEDRLPGPGDVAEVWLVDLETGEQRAVAETRGWDTQLGAQAQWGADDHSLFYNDVDTDTWTPFGVRLDPATGARTRLDGTVYMVSPDGKWAASPCLLRAGLTQLGYGVLVPDAHIPRNHGFATDDGLYVTDTETGACRLLVSLAEIFEKATPALDRDKYAGGAFYGFHVKWNADASRLMLVIRWVPPGGTRATLNNVITLDADGGNLHVAVPDAIWSRGGHHPNWCPDGEHILINLKPNTDELRFVSVRYDGADMRELHDDLLGSGHPTLHPDGRHIVTDVYCGRKPLAFDDGTIPIRWVDLETGDDRQLVRIKTLPDYVGPVSQLRVDPHPAWDRSFTRIAFNACPTGKRQVFIAGLSKEVAG